VVPRIEVVPVACRTVSKEQMSSVSQQQVIEMPSQTTAMERHFSVAEVAAAWNLSADAVRRLFLEEAGVLVIEPPRTKFSRRRYRTLRIPAAVVERVHKRMSISSATQTNPARSAK
jgi:hypothetical protein